MSEHERDEMLLRAERLGSLVKLAWAAVLGLCSVVAWGAVDRATILNRLERVETYGSEPVRGIDARLDRIEAQLAGIQATLQERR